MIQVFKDISAGLVPSWVYFSLMTFFFLLINATIQRSNFKFDYQYNDSYIIFYESNNKTLDKIKCACSQHFHNSRI